MMFHTFSNKDVRPQVSHWIVFVIISSAPLSIWLTRNWFVSGTLTGPRDPSSVSLYENIERTPRSFFSWFMLHESLPLIIQVVTFLISVGLMIIVLIATLTRYKIISAPILAHLVFFLIYTGFTVISSTITHCDAIGTVGSSGVRFLIPTYVSLMILFIATLDFLFQHKYRPIVKQFASVAYIVFIVGVF